MPPSISCTRFVDEVLAHVPFSPRQREVFEAIDAGATQVQLAWAAFR